MKEAKNGFEYLKKLRERTEEEKQPFYRFQRYLEKKAREEGVPLNGQFELTPLCNFDCKMCYAHLTPAQLHEQPIMTVEQWKELMHDAWEAGMMKVTLTGGECLAYSGFKEIYLYLHNLGCEITVLTNGFLLGEEWLEFFKEHRPASIRITLYGNNEEAYERVTGHRGYQTVIDNIRRIREASLPLVITITPNRFMGEDAFETVRIARELNENVIVNTGLFDPREETGRSGQSDDMDMEHYLRIYRYLEELDGREIVEIPEKDLPRIGSPARSAAATSADHAECANNASCGECPERGFLCGAGRSSFVVDWKGTMIACNRFRVVQSHPMKEGFKAAWQKTNDTAANWPSVPECKECPYSVVCSHCPANMLQYAEPGKQPIEMCERVKYMVQHGVWKIPEC